MEIQGDYPQKIESIKNNDSPFWKNGDKINYFFIVGGNDDYFKA